MADTQVPTPTAPKADRWLGWAVRLLWLPLLGLLHLGLVNSLVALGAAADITADDNHWLRWADALNIYNPEVHVATARYLRGQALLVDEPERTLKLQRALVRWDRAQEFRPHWPYYQLAALDIEVMLNAPAVQIRSRIDRIISMAPNERGLDKALLELMLFSWAKMTPDQQRWTLARIETTQHQNRRFLFDVAANLGLTPILCSRLPWTIARPYCRR